MKLTIQPNLAYHVLIIIFFYDANENRHPRNPRELLDNSKWKGGTLPKDKLCMYRVGEK